MVTIGTDAASTSTITFAISIFVFVSWHWRRYGMAFSIYFVVILSSSLSGCIFASCFDILRVDRLSVYSIYIIHWPLPWLLSVEQCRLSGISLSKPAFDISW